MKKLIVLLFLAPLYGICGNGYVTSGAAASGMANASLTRQDVWALFHNPSGIAYTKAIHAGMNYEQRFSLKELSTNSFAVAIPVGKTGAIGVNASYFGNKNYNEQTGGLTYARVFSDRISGGIKLNYSSFHLAEEYGTRSIVTGDIGMQAKLARNLWLGLRIFNPSQTELVKSPTEQIPSVLSLGTGYIFSEKLRAELMVEKSSDEKALMRSGIEYHPVKEFWFRAGIASQPLASSFGFGLELQNIQLDFSAGFHPQLGFTPNISLSYTFPEKK